MCVSGMCMGMCGVWVCERSACGVCEWFVHMSVCMRCMSVWVCIVCGVSGVCMGVCGVCVGVYGVWCVCVWVCVVCVWGVYEWLCCAGAAAKRYPTSKVRETQMRW